MFRIKLEGDCMSTKKVKVALKKKRSKRASVDELIRREKLKLKRLEQLSKLKTIRLDVESKRQEYLEIEV